MSGEAWFCAKDVFETLGIAWKGVSGSLKNTPEEWQGVCYLQTPGGTQDAVFLSEPAVYRCKSAGPKAPRLRLDTHSELDGAFGLGCICLVRVTIMGVRFYKEPDVESNYSIGVLTDCAEEDRFIRLLAAELAYTFRTMDPEKYPKDGFMPSCIEIEEGEENKDALFQNSMLSHVIEPILRNSIEICLKYRGYKAKVSERRELYAGEIFPDRNEAIGDSKAEP